MPAPNALEIEQHNILKFRDDFLDVYQQKGSVLLPFVTETQQSGSGAALADTFGEATTQRSDTRFRDNPHMVTQRKRRWIAPEIPIEWGEYIETEDMLRQMRNPQSKLLRAGAMAVGRDVDQIILKGMLGPVMEGQLIQGATSVNLPAKQTVPIATGSDDGTTPTGLNPEKLRVAFELFGENNVDLRHESPYLAITPRQHSDLSRFVELTSADFFRTNEQPYYVSGKLTSVMGFNLVVFNQLPKTAAVRTNVAWMKDDVEAGCWYPVTPDAWHDTSKRKLPYLYCKAIYGAARTQDAGVITLPCHEAPRP